MGIQGSSCAYRGCPYRAFMGCSGYCHHHNYLNYEQRPTRVYSTPLCTICRKEYAMSGYALCEGCNSTQQALKTQGYTGFYGKGR